MSQGKEKTIIRAIALFLLAVILLANGHNVWVIIVVCLLLWLLFKAIENVLFQEAEEEGSSSNEPS